MANEKELSPAKALLARLKANKSKRDSNKSELAKLTKKQAADTPAKSPMSPDVALYLNRRFA